MSDTDIRRTGGVALQPVLNIPCIARDGTGSRVNVTPGSLDSLPAVAVLPDAVSVTTGNAAKFD